jgi:hypothetical protein
MPGGLFEFWPMFDIASAPKVLAGLGSPPTVRVAVQPGDNRVEMRFERK